MDELRAGGGGWFTRSVCLFCAFPAKSDSGGLQEAGVEGSCLLLTMSVSQPSLFLGEAACCTSPTSYVIF